MATEPLIVVLAVVGWLVVWPRPGGRVRRFDRDPGSAGDSLGGLDGRSHRPESSPRPPDRGEVDRGSGPSMRPSFRTNDLAGFPRAGRWVGWLIPLILACLGDLGTRSCQGPSAGLEGLIVVPAWLRPSSPASRSVRGSAQGRQRPARAEAWLTTPESPTLGPMGIRIARRSIRADDRALDRLRGQPGRPGAVVARRRCARSRGEVAPSNGRRATGRQGAFVGSFHD